MNIDYLCAMKQMTKLFKMICLVVGLLAASVDGYSWG